ncbi:peptide chain release factor N(5)-glutamine methyltransferase [Tannerella sp.]|uniref:peptide chain release factor N(5)-glutamine methyltransferase n=1 Tax=Tannerella sp. TaxID=2382127 RepID=UPI0026DB55F6|nr:peptide chain release factor N(5)-glutamine methyltransferase [Tannerella sp.]MDO4704403.1 peptide chain release factor N(5)-glutamine methyltransferase [Tannerella sp.]
MQATTAYIRETLSGTYSTEEIRNLTRWLFERVCGLTLARQILCKDKQIAETEKEAIRRVVERLSRSEPIQYILGECEFHGLRFEVTPSVLIPRPETSELVELIVRRHPEAGLKVLDIGTGSGCIAVSLAKMLHKATVTAIDISDDALAVARRNAETHQVDVRFLQADILSESSLHEVALSAFDVLVSNPPYVTEREKAGMEAHVLRYEPAQALFVSDSDPLCFYRHIAARGRKWLSEGGRLYFEINAAYGKELVSLLKAMDYRDVEIGRDISGKERFIQCSKT